MKRLLLVLIVAALPANAISPTKAEIREARRIEVVKCFIAQFFGRSCSIS